MHAQERAALVAARLKACTYRGDRIDALREAKKIAESDTITAGTYFLDILCTMVQSMEMTNEDVLYSVLNTIITGKSGSEFIDIMCKKHDAADIVVKYMVDRSTEESSEIEKMVCTIAKEKQREIQHRIMSAQEQDSIFDGVEKGKKIVLDVLHIVERGSASMRKFMVYSGAVESLMALGARAKDTHTARKALDMLAEMIGEGREVAEYIAEIGWIEWMKKIAEKHTHHSTSVLYAMLAQSTTKKSVHAVFDTIMKKKDTMCIYMGTQHSAEVCKEIAETKHKEVYNRMVEQYKASQCITRANCMLGIESNIQEMHTAKRGIAGDVQYMAYIMHSTEPVDEMEIVEYLYTLQDFSKLSYTEAVVYMKTAAVIVSKDNTEIMYSAEIVRIVKEIVATEETEHAVKVLSAYWLMKAQTHAKKQKQENTTEHIGEMLKSTEDTCTVLVGHLVASLVGIQKEGIQCESKKCKRCYYKEMTAQSVYVPAECRALANALWMPKTMHKHILAAYTEHIEIRDREIQERIAKEKVQEGVEEEVRVEVEERVQEGVREEGVQGSTVQI